MHVVVDSPRLRPAAMASSKSSRGPASPANRSCTGATQSPRSSVTTTRSPAGERRPMSTIAPERPSGASAIWPERRSASASAAAGRRTERSSSPGAKRARPGAGHELGDRHLAGRSGPVPDGAHAVKRRGEPEIIGPAGSARQMFPPTVAAFHTLNEAEQGRCSTGGSAARAAPPAAPPSAVQLSQGARRGDLQPVAPAASDGQPNAGHVDQPGAVRLRLGEQPGAAGQRRVARPPAPRWIGYLGDRGQVQGSAPRFRVDHYLLSFRYPR